MSDLSPERKKKLIDCIDAVYRNIAETNRTLSRRSVPLSDDFAGRMSKSLNIPVTSVYFILSILSESHRIFSFPVVEEDCANKIPGIAGYVISDGHIISTLSGIYDGELETAYMKEFSAKLTSEAIRTEVASRRKDFNNTPAGRLAAISGMLRQCARTLEHDILKYGKKWQDRQFEEEIGKANIPAEFFSVRKESGSFHEEVKNCDSIKTPQKPAGQHKEFDLKSEAARGTIEKTIRVYGIEFYARTCFKNYQFALLQKIIEENVVVLPADLTLIKEVLRRVRGESDKDLNLQKYAVEINALEKCINSRLKG